MILQESAFGSHSNHGWTPEGPHDSQNGSADAEQQWYSPQSVGKVLNRPSLLRSSLSGKLHMLGSSPHTAEKNHGGLNRVPSDPLLLQSIPTFHDELSNEVLMERTMSATNLTRDAIQRLSDSQELPSTVGHGDGVRRASEEEPRKKRRGFWPFSGGSKENRKDKEKEREKEKAAKNQAKRLSKTSISLENGHYSSDDPLPLKQGSQAKSLENSQSLNKRTGSLWRGRSFSKKGTSWL